MKESIRLHKTRGVNPRLTVCRNCGEAVGAALLGANDGLYRCDPCRKNGIGHSACELHVAPTTPCPSCKVSMKFIRNLDESEALPIELCKPCQAKEEACSVAVREGGIFWRCSTCGSKGAIKADAPIAKAVRAQLKIAAPDPCGVEFDKDDCSVCSPEAV